ncbi:unnamed protein product [Rhodiola kirilowii]
MYLQVELASRLQPKANFFKIRTRKQGLVVGGCFNESQPKTGF